MIHYGEPGEDHTVRDEAGDPCLDINNKNIVCNKHGAHQDKNLNGDQSRWVVTVRRDKDGAWKKMKFHLPKEKGKNCVDPMEVGIDNLTLANLPAILGSGSFGNKIKHSIHCQVGCHIRT